MRCRATLEIYQDPINLYKCLIAETTERERSVITLKKYKDHLGVNIEAKDLTAMKAALNSIIQLLAVYKQMKELK